MPKMKHKDIYANDCEALGEAIGKRIKNSDRISDILDVMLKCLDGTEEKNAKLFCRALASKLEAKRGELDKLSYYVGDEKHSSAYFIRRFNKKLTAAEKQIFALFYAKESRIAEIAKLTGKTQSCVYKKLGTAYKKSNHLGWDWTCTRTRMDTVRRTLEKLYGKTPEGVTLYEESYLDGLDYYSNSVIVEDESPEYVRADLIISKNNYTTEIATFGVGARKMIKGKNLGGYITVGDNGNNNDRIELCASLSKNFDVFSKNGLLVQREIQRLAKYPFAENRFLGTCSMLPASAEYEKCFGYSHLVLSEWERRELPDGDVVRIMKLIPIYRDEYEAALPNNPITTSHVLPFGESYPIDKRILLDKKRAHYDKKIFEISRPWDENGT